MTKRSMPRSRMPEHILEQVLEQVGVRIHIIQYEKTNWIYPDLDRCRHGVYDVSARNFLGSSIQRFIVYCRLSAIYVRLLILPHVV